MDFHAAIAKARELVKQRDEIDRQLAELKQLSEIFNASKPKRKREKKPPANDNARSA